jgi:hypothetical protein
MHVQIMNPFTAKGFSEFGAGKIQKKLPALIPH